MARWCAPCTSGKEKPINMKSFGGTPPHRSLDVSRFVLQKCPVCHTDIYTEIRSGRPGCPGSRPQIVPQDTSESSRLPNCFFFGSVLRCKSCDPKVLLRRPENGKFPEVVRGWCKRSFGPRAPKASCTDSKELCTGAKTVVVQKTLGRPLLPGFKTPFAPSPNYFWGF